MRHDHPNDFSTRLGAAALANRIAEYWRERGYAVLLSIEEKGFHPATRAVRFEVRSDLVDGLPRERITPQSPIALPAMFRCIRLDLLDDQIEQSRSGQACLLTVPLAYDGRIDSAVAEEYYGACRVLRRRAGNEYEEGFLSPVRDGSWRIARNLGGGTNDAYLFPPEAGLQTGAHLTIKDGGNRKLYRVNAVTSIELD